MFLLLIGVSGSGKSYFAQRNIWLSDVLLSSDGYRSIIGNGENDQTVSSVVFDVLEWNVRYFLKQGQTVLLDATNLNRKSRKRFIKASRDVGKEIIACYFDIPIEVCKERKEKGERKVLNSVIEKQFAKLEKPTKEEVDYLYVVDKEGVAKEEF